GFHGGIDAIDDGRVAEFFVVGTAFVVGHRIAVKGGGDELLGGGLGEQIAGELLNGELVVGHIPIKRVDDPIAVAPHGAAPIRFVAFRIGIAGEVEPLAGPAFAVVRTAKEFADVILVCDGARVGDKERDIVGIGREAGKV